MPGKKPVLWEPMKDLMDMESTFSRFFAKPHLFRKMFSSEGMLSPDMDVFEKEDKLIIHADIPGIEKNDIHINIEGDTLTIRGERKKDEEIKEEEK